MFDWLKVFPYVFRETIKGIRELQDMSGGRRRGQFVFWSVFLTGLVIVLLLIMWFVPHAYEQLSQFLSHFNISISHVEVNIPSSLPLNLLITVLLVIAYMAVLFGIVAAIGSVLSSFISALFAPNTTARVDTLFSKLLPLLNKSKQERPQDGAIAEVMKEAEAVWNRWDRSRVTRMSRWFSRIIGQSKKGKK